VAFPALALFNLLRFPLMMLPEQILNLIQGLGFIIKVALARIHNYMDVGSLHPPPPPPPRVMDCILDVVDFLGWAFVHRAAGKGLMSCLTAGRHVACDLQLHRKILEQQ